MELGGQYSYGIPGAASRGRISGLAEAGEITDVAMIDASEPQLACTSADAELEELCNSLPGWHQQQTLHDPSGLIGGLTRTVSAPCAFLPSPPWSNQSPGGNCPVEGFNCLPRPAQQQQPYAATLPIYEELSSLSRQPSLVARWLLRGQPTMPLRGSTPLRHCDFAADAVVDGANNFTLAGLTSDPPVPHLDARSWSRPPSWATTSLPSGEQHEQQQQQQQQHHHHHAPALRHGLVPVPIDLSDPSAVPLPPCQPPPPHYPVGRSGLTAQHHHHQHRHQQQHQHQHQPPRLSQLAVGQPGLGLSDWPSGGQLVGGSSGPSLPLLSGPLASAVSTLTGPLALSLSGSFLLPRHDHANCCVERPAGQAADPPVTGSAAVESTAPGGARGGVGLGLELGLTGGGGGGGGGGGSPTAGPSWKRGGRGDGASSAGAGAGAGAGAADGEMQLIMQRQRQADMRQQQRQKQDMEQDGSGDGGGGGGGRGGGDGGQSASSGSSMCAAVNGALLAAAACDAAAAAAASVDANAARRSGGGGGGALAAAAVGFCNGTDGDAAAMADESEGASGGGGGGGGGPAGADGSGGAATADGSGSASWRGASTEAATHAAGEAPAPAGNDEGGLQLLAMRFRSRPGRVPKAVARLGPIAELAKNAATGRIKLEKEELEDLVTTVETRLARAVTEQKADSRARNRVAQQRFRSRQRETIAALQSRVEEQEALIAALQDKIQLYEAQVQAQVQAHRQQQQHQQQLAASQREGGAAIRAVRAAQRPPANE